ncbi:MAG: hypothetical protein U9O94_11380 [Nanoarchaeota archaeon]|nr:hypothetical protein [Nanoarchaeota archaeon]
MFNFLKRLFFEQEKPKVVEKEEIEPDNLENWFQHKTNKVYSDLDVSVKKLKGNIEENVLKTKDNLALLGTAKLHNPKISVREKQFMEGNRKAYILGVNNFLRSVRLEEKEYLKLLELCSDFGLKLDKFSKSTARPYHILQEFFANESKNIAINIKNLESSIKGLESSIKNTHIDQIDKTKEEIISLNNKIKQKKDLDNLLGEKGKIKEGLIKNKEEISNKLSELLKSKEYAHLNDLKANKEVFLASIREHNTKVIHAFSVMEKPLKKMVRVVLEDANLLEEYMKDSVNALIKDSNLKIIGLLVKLKNNINNYTLELKDKKREKVLETISGLTEEFLREFINKHKELNEKLENIETEIDTNGSLKEENKLNYELSNVNDNLEKVGDEINNNHKELGKIDIKEMKHSLQKEMNNLLKAEIVIS